jgi:hypothetical protein
LKVRPDLSGSCSRSNTGFDIQFQGALARFNVLVAVIERCAGRQILNTGQAASDGRQIVERLMELKRIPQPTISEIRHTFTAMINRLQEDAEKISDDLVGKAKLVQLKTFLAHSKDISEPDELLDFCLSALTTMKCSIGALRLGRQGRSIEKALKVLRVHGRAGLSSILFERLERLGEAASPKKRVA